MKVQPHVVQALWAAVQGGCLLDAKMLLDANAPELQFVSNYDMLNDCLLESCFRGNLDMCKLLVQHGADVTYFKRPDRMSPLHEAVKNGHLEMCHFLFENGAFMDENGCAAFKEAVMTKKTEIAKFILECIGVERMGPSLWEWAQISGLSRQTARMLIQVGLNPVWLLRFPHGQCSKYMRRVCTVKEIEQAQALFKVKKVMET